MAIIDYVLAMKKLETDISNAIRKQNKKFHVRDITFHNLGNNVHGVLVECSEPVSMNDIIIDVIRKSKYGEVVSSRTHKGSFDWAADTYIKDCADVDYRVK